MYKRITCFFLIMIFVTVFVPADKDRDKKIEECQPLLREARELHMKGNTKAAIDKIKEAIEKVPDYHNFYNFLAFLYQNQKDFRNQYLAAKKTVELYEKAKERGETRNMNDIFYMNYAAACVNYSYELRQKGDYKAEVEMLVEGLKYFKLFTTLQKDARMRKIAEEQIKVIENDLLLQAKKALSEEN